MPKLKKLPQHTLPGARWTTFLSSALRLRSPGRSSDYRCCRLPRLPSLHKRRIHSGRRSASRKQSNHQGLGRPVPVLVHHRTDGLLAGDQYHILDRVAVVGNEFDGLPRHQPDLAHRRIIADLDYFAEVVHSRGIFGGLDLRRASGERGVGGLDRAAEKHDGDVVFPVVDSVVFEIRRTRSPTNLRMVPGLAAKQSTAHCPPSTAHYYFLVLAEPGGVRIGDAQQGIGGGLAGAAFGNRLVAAAFDKTRPVADCAFFPGCRRAD